MKTLVDTVPPENEGTAFWQGAVEGANVASMGNYPSISFFSLNYPYCQGYTAGYWLIRNN